MKEPITAPKVRFEYMNEFGDETIFLSTVNGVTIDDMMEVYCRFLLSCGYGWDSVKPYHPDYIECSHP